MLDEWRPIKDFPRYSVSDVGRIQNIDTERIMKPYKLPSGHLSIGLFKDDGIKYSRSISKLVASAFLSRPNEHFNTPIHLDGDLGNCCMDNLMWRPRWFASRYTRQFSQVFGPSVPLRNKKTGEEFHDPWELVTTKGLLYMDLILSAANQTCVFPTMEFYEWIE